MTVRNRSPRAQRGLASLALLLTAMPVQSETKDYTEVSLSELVELDIYAPSVLRSHFHEKGEWMVGYEYMTMSMEGNLDGTDSVSNQDILQQFMVARTSMSMDMHIFHLMYAPSDDVTLMAMIGAFLGWQACVLIFFLSPFFGLVPPVLALLSRSKPRDHGTEVRR